MSMSVSPFSLSLNLTNKSRYIFNLYELKNHKNMRGGTPSLPPLDRKQWPIVARENLHYPFNSVIRKLGQDTQTVCVCNM